MSWPQNAARCKKCSKDVYNGTIPSLSRTVATLSFFIVHSANSFYILVDARVARRTKRPDRALAGWNSARYRHVPQFEPSHRRL